MKFQPGTFIEVDDLVGGRKVVMVARDGVTYWDALDPNLVTPLFIHPSLKPVALGSFVEYNRACGFAGAGMEIVRFLRGRFDTRVDSDPLFLMRVLWLTVQRATTEKREPDAQLVAWACDQAQVQQKSAVRVHGYAAKFCETI